MQGISKRDGATARTQWSAETVRIRLYCGAGRHGDGGAGRYWQVLSPGRDGTGR